MENDCLHGSGKNNNNKNIKEKKVEGAPDNFHPHGADGGGWRLKRVLLSAVSPDTVTEEEPECRRRTVGHEMTKGSELETLKINPYNESMTTRKHKVKLRKWRRGQ